MIEQFKQIIGNSRVCILGYGAEGKSSLRLLRRILPEERICVADARPGIGELPELLQSKISVIAGDAYLSVLSEYDLIIKTPGIPSSLLAGIPAAKITSQSELFIRTYAPQIIGITGTKGKSTTSSLICHLIRQQTSNTILVGNIGIPPFDLADRIDKDTRIVYELSSHQLENARYSPHIAILLNLFEEHLDHYNGRDEYFMAKMNIALHQENSDYFLYHQEDPTIQKIMESALMKAEKCGISSLGNPGAMARIEGDSYLVRSANHDYRIPLTTGRLRGDHNRLNILFAIAACLLSGIEEERIIEGIDSFNPLSHRLEYVGCYQGIHYYNDSIATIPEACMAAMAAIPDVGSVIIGGFDRGIDYREFAVYLAGTAVDALIFMGMAGRRIHSLYLEAGGNQDRVWIAEDLAEAVMIAQKQTAPGKACLLSPAAASYDQFKNFEERGEVFRRLASGQS
jgi:UDP-N-acetylmuramoylalanine--D-glutamate ligase